MKKFSVILLIAVLAMTSVFADVDVKIAGSVEASYTADFDDKSFGYSVPNDDLTVTFGYTSPAGGIVGEGLRAEVATKLTWTPKTAWSTEDAAKTFAEVGSFKLAVSSFDLKYKDVWSWNLLAAKAVGNFAKSPLDFEAYKNSAGVVTKAAYDDAYKITATNGTTFTWNGFTFAAALDGALQADVEKNIYVGVETPNFTLGKGFTLKGAGAFEYDGAAEPYEALYYAVPGNKISYKTVCPTCKEGAIAVCATCGKYHCDTCGATFDAGQVVDKNQTPCKDWQKTEYADKWLVAGSLKLGFKADFMEITAATDHAIHFGKGVEKLTYDVDALLTAKFAPATLNVYFAKNAKAQKDAKATTFNSFKNLFSAKAEFDLSPFHAPLKASVSGLNLLNDARILSTEFQFTIAEKYVIKAFGLDLLGKAGYANGFDEAQAEYYKDNGEGQKIGLGTSLTFGPVVVDADVYTRLARKNVGFDIAAEYTNAYFTADAGIKCEFTAQDAAAKRMKLNAGIESDVLIQNATVSLSYASGNIFKGDYAEYGQFAKTTSHGIGAVTTSVLVEF